MNKLTFDLTDEAFKSVLKCFKDVKNWTIEDDCVSYSNTYSNNPSQNNCFLLYVPYDGTCVKIKNLSIYNYDDQSAKILMTSSEQGARLLDYIDEIYDLKTSITNPNQHIIDVVKNF